MVDRMKIMLPCLAFIMRYWYASWMLISDLEITSYWIEETTTKELMPKNSSVKTKKPSWEMKSAVPQELDPVMEALFCPAHSEQTDREE